MQGCRHWIRTLGLLLVGDNTPATTGAETECWMAAWTPGHTLEQQMLETANTIWCGRFSQTAARQEPLEPHSADPWLFTHYPLQSRNWRRYGVPRAISPRSRTLTTTPAHRPAARQSIAQALISIRADFAGVVAAFQRDVVGKNQARHVGLARYRPSPSMPSRNSAPAPFCSKTRRQRPAGRARPPRSPR